MKSLLGRQWLTLGGWQGELPGRTVKQTDIWTVEIVPPKGTCLK